MVCCAGLIGCRSSETKPRLNRQREINTHSLGLWVNIPFLILTATHRGLGWSTESLDVAHRQSAIHLSILKRDLLSMACPLNSIRYNGSLCACQPGYLLTRPSNTCSLFTADSSITSESGVDYFSISFPETIFAFDSIKKFTQSQAVFLEATLVMLLSWLLLCFFLRFTSLGDGSTLWFNIRWWISRLDICFATRNWLVSSPLLYLSLPHFHSPALPLILPSFAHIYFLLPSIFSPGLLSTVKRKRFRT